MIYYEYIYLFIFIMNIVHKRNLECGFGNRRPTGEAKTHVLGTFYFWNNLPTTLCANGLTLRMMQKHHQKILHRSIFLIYWYLEGFQHLECGLPPCSI